MVEKLVYDPKEDAKNRRNAATKKPTKKDIVYPQPANPTKTTKAKKEKPAKAAKSTKPVDVKPEEPVTQFKAKLNKWGFIHVPKEAIPSLPFKIEQPLTARIEGETLVITAATK